jgi:mannose/fructose-specific phosphotransferase system component IIA
MSDELRGVVVCHGRLAAALIDAAEQISGVRDALVPVTNTDCDRGTLEERIAQAVNGAAAVFVDLASGSCLFAVLNRLRQAAGVTVVTGVNLAMLVDFLFHRTLPAEEAASHAAQAGGKAIGTR